MSPTQIIIVGAGLAGVTLARCLLSKGLLPILVEQSPLHLQRHNYSIELHSATYRPLLSVLGLDEAAFKRHVSVRQYATATELSIPQDAGFKDRNVRESFRCHRGRLEALLGEGLNIKQKHKITKVAQEPTRVRVEIEDGSSLEASMLVAADGVHSAVRKALIPELDTYVHPYVVFYGTRTVSMEHYTTSIAAEMNGVGLLETRYDDVLLRVFINNVTSSEVVLGYTYSREARSGSKSDPLHNPERSAKDAKAIPDAFHLELRSLRNLSSGFAEMFDPEKVRQDRVLHWLMRSSLPDRSDMVSLAAKGVVIVGDAAHAMPILGGEGGNQAMRDGMELAEWIKANGIARMEDFVSSTYLQWKDGVEQSVQNLQKMHKDDRPSL